MKNDKNIIKIVSLLLVSVMTAAMLFSCGGNEENNPQEGTQTGNGTSETEQTESEKLVEELYGARKSDYSGRKFRIYALEPGSHGYSAIGESANEVWFEDAGSDVFQKSIFERNRSTEELLGIEITPVWGKTSEEIADKINMDKDAGTDDYDAALLSLMEGMNCAQNDAVLNLMDYSAFDETHSWWNQTFVKQCTLFGNQIYTIAGAINIWDDCSNRMMVFNQDILDRYNCESPYQQVFDGTWTIENMMASAMACTQDLNGDQEFDENDCWGVGSGGMTLYDNITGLDTAVSKIGDEGYPVLYCKDEEHVRKVEYFFQNIINTDYMYYEGVTGSDDYMTLFGNSQLAFGYVMLANSFSLRGMEDYCGVLPNAKYNEAQENYTSAANPAWFTAYVVPKTCTDPDFAITCLEVMSAYSVDTLDYNLNEVVLQSKVARDQDARRCFNIIKDTLSFDWSFLGSWRGDLLMAYELKYGYAFNFVSRIESSYDAAQTKLDAMVDFYRDRSF